jgi:hypothetical protein
MPKLKVNQNLLVFIFCIAVLTGPAISTVMTFDSSTIGNTDTRTYMGLAKFDLKQNPKRRYRVIVPALAAAVNTGSFLWNKMAPKDYKEDFALVFSFFIVNLLLMSLFGLLIYKYIVSFNVNHLAALFGVLAMLTCRYTSLCIGTPLAESLYFVMIALTLLGIRTNNYKMLLLAIFIGPFSKEAFIFIAPLIFFFSNIPKLKQIVLFILSAAIVFSFRYLFDRYTALPPAQGLLADVRHINNLVNSLRTVFSPKGMLGIVFTVGGWILFVLMALPIPPYKQKLKQLASPLHICFMVAVFIQILLAGSMDRMLYLAMPVFCLVVALAAEALIKSLNKNTAQPTPLNH